MKANTVWIDGEAYSQFHPKVKEMKLVKKEIFVEDLPDQKTVLTTSEFSAGGSGDGPAQPGVATGLPSRADSPESPRHLPVSGQAPPARAFVSTDEAKLNKTEKRFLEWLRTGPWVKWIGIQNITLKLADDCRLTPDFCYLDGDCVPTFVDVKGFQREDALIKMKVAARMVPWARFQIVKLIKGQWQFTEVKP